MDPLHLVLGWGVFWTCLHAVILPISVKVLLCMLPRHGNEIRAAYASMDSHARAYWRRCARSLVYYVFATVAGILLLGDFASVEVWRLCVSLSVCLRQSVMRAACVLLCVSKCAPVLYAAAYVCLVIV